VRPSVKSPVKPSFIPPVLHIHIFSPDPMSNPKPNFSRYKSNLFISIWCQYVIICFVPNIRRILTLQQFNNICTSCSYRRAQTFKTIMLILFKKTRTDYYFFSRGKYVFKNVLWIRKIELRKYIVQHKPRKAQTIRIWNWMKYLLS